MNDNIIGQTFRKCRHMRGLTLEEFSSIVEIDTSYISKIERGVTLPRIGTFFRLAQGLDMKPSQLMQMIEKAQEEEQ